jgi:hypothetical protein
LKKRGNLKKKPPRRTRNRRPKKSIQPVRKGVTKPVVVIPKKNVKATAPESSPVQANKKKLKVNSSADASAPSSPNPPTKLAPLPLLDPPPPPSKPHLPIPLSDLDYVNYLPKIIQPEVCDILDIQSDCHCGFQAVGRAIIWRFGTSCMMKLFVGLIGIKKCSTKSRGLWLVSRSHQHLVQRLIGCPCLQWVR